MEPHLREKGKIILWVLLVFLVGTLAIGMFGNTLSLVQTSRTIPNSGSLKGIGVGVYWDSACTNRTSSISWGALEPGSNKTVTVYVKNEGNSAATLSKFTQNWNPSTASDPMTLNWNYAGQTLSVNQVLQIKLTLTISPTISGIATFGFDVLITATG